jgi:hypothetical protein
MSSRSLGLFLRGLLVAAAVGLPLLALFGGPSVLAFQWLSRGRFDLGALLFGLGAVGAWAAAFLGIAVSFPASSDNLRLMKEIERLKTSRDALLALRQNALDAPLSESDQTRLAAAKDLESDLDAILARLEDQYHQQRGRTLALAWAGYAFAGGLVSAAFAPLLGDGLAPQVIWQAVVIGFLSAVILRLAREGLAHLEAAASPRG